MTLTEGIVVIGIDPGLDGGIAALPPLIRGDVVLSPMPVIAIGKRRQIDEHAVVDMLRPLVRGELPLHVFVEHVQAMPRQGVVSMFNFGVGWGLIRGICSGLGITYELVRPQAWQRVLLAGHPKGSEYLVASRLWPDADWRASERSRKPHGGMVDAALIAEYGRRRLAGAVVPVQKREVIAVIQNPELETTALDMLERDTAALLSCADDAMRLKLGTEVARGIAQARPELLALGAAAAGCRRLAQARAALDGIQDNVGVWWDTTPAMADVLCLLRVAGCTQDDAVVLLGGRP